MCGRYLLTATPQEVAGLFAADVRDNFPPRYNIAPTQPIAVIRMGQTRAREYALVRWGLIPPWMSAEKGRPLTNARAETVAEKPSFRAAFKRRRCLVPANGFYEWTGEKGARLPYLIAPCEDGLFAFAGIWERVLAPDGSEADTAAILTVEAGPDISPIHNREPAVINAAHFTDWLETDERDVANLKPLIAGGRSGFWRARRVSPRVNNARNEGAELIAPIEEEGAKMADKKPPQTELF